MYLPLHGPFEAMFVIFILLPDCDSTHGCYPICEIHRRKKLSREVLHFTKPICRHHGARELFGRNRRWGTHERGYKPLNPPRELSLILIYPRLSSYTTTSLFSLHPIASCPTLLKPLTSTSTLTPSSLAPSKLRTASGSL